MKKLAFFFMGIALCATLFSSCKKDDDDDVNKDEPPFIASLTCSVSGQQFNGTAVAKASSGSSSASADETGSKVDIMNLMKGGEKTTVYGIDKNTKAFMSLTFKGGKGATGHFSGGINATEALIAYLQGGSIADVISGAVDSFIIYKASAQTDASDKKGFWFSIDSNVDITVNQGFIMGTFSGKLKNASNDTYEISNGKISCLGL